MSLSCIGRFATAVISVLSLAACAPIRVQSFEERGFDITRYRTYDWAAEDQLATGDPRLDSNPFFLNELKRNVEKELASRGLERTGASPALRVHYHVRITEEVDVNGLDRQYGYATDRQPYVIEAGTLMLDVVDARTNKLVWRGWAENSMDGVIDNQKWMEERIQKTVAQILDRLPG